MKTLQNLLAVALLVSAVSVRAEDSDVEETTTTETQTTQTTTENGTEDTSTTTEKAKFELGTLNPFNAERRAAFVAKAKAAKAAFEASAVWKPSEAYDVTAVEGKDVSCKKAKEFFNNHLVAFTRTKRAAFVTAVIAIVTGAVVGSYVAYKKFFGKTEEKQAQLTDLLAHYTQLIDLNGQETELQSITEVFVAMEEVVAKLAEETQAELTTVVEKAENALAEYSDEAAAKALGELTTVVEKAQAELNIAVEEVAAAETAVDAQ